MDAPYDERMTPAANKISARERARSATAARLAEEQARIKKNEDDLAQTESVGKLWRPIEYVFNTPSHHRVHHGSDPEYLDKNYAGILIIWDRMFGTFQEEMHRPTYGLTTPVGTYNLLKLQYGEYANMVRDVRGAQRWRHKLGYIFAPPGWQPADQRAVPAPPTTAAVDG